MKKILFLLIIVFSYTACAQNNPPRVSPKATVSQTVGYTDILVTYSRPGVKERDVWGELVPFDKVWRTGANEATTIEFSDEVEINGSRIPSGKYSLFTIPGKQKWVLIFNKTFDQWGAFSYDEKKDQIRIEATPKANAHVESMRFLIEYKDAYSAVVSLQWEKLKIEFDVKSMTE